MSTGHSAESPDEEALVSRVDRLGIRMVERVPEESIILEMGNTRHVFQVLATIEFTSDRKKMSRSFCT